MKIDFNELEAWLDTMHRYGHDPVTNPNGTLKVEPAVRDTRQGHSGTGIWCSRCLWGAVLEPGRNWTNRRMVPRKCV